MKSRIHFHPQMKDWIGIEITADSGRHLFWGDLTRFEATEMYEGLGKALGSTPK